MGLHARAAGARARQAKRRGPGDGWRSGDGVSAPSGLPAPGLMIRATLAAALFASVAAYASSGRAADEADDPPKRPIPDYGNRGPRPTDAGDVALGVVRVVVSPLYFVSEYAI